MLVEMTAEHLPHVRHLLQETISACIDAEPEAQSRIIDHSLTSSAHWLAAGGEGVHLAFIDPNHNSENHVIGMILVKDYWNLVNLYVSPDAQCQGIASALIATAIERCRRHATHEKLRLNSSYFAAGFYQKMGFKQCGEERPAPGGCIPFEYDLTDI